jgi:hypothetical protein
MFGKTELDDDVVKYYSTNDFFLAGSVANLEKQIYICIQCLKLFTDRRGIATTGFKYGLQILQRDRGLFKNFLVRDPLFGVKFAYLLDRVFQNFVNELGNLHSEERPIQRSWSRLKNYQGDAINRALTGYHVSSIPNLYLPSSLSAPPLEESRRPETEKRERKDDRENDLAWWSRNPNPAPKWSLPSGKKYSDFFDSRSPELKGNTLDWPKFPHHKRPTKSKLLCVRYQAVGQCNAKCFMAHIDPSKVEEAVRATFNARFQSIYSWQLLRKSSALADRAMTERFTQNPQHHPEHRHHFEHPSLLDSPAPSTNKRKLESHPGNSTIPLRESRTNREQPTEKEGQHRERLNQKAGKGRRSEPLNQKADEGRRACPRATRQNANTKETPRHNPTRSNLDIGDSQWKSDEDYDPGDDLAPANTMTDIERVANRRNLDRIKRANISDQQLLSKYLPSSVEDFLPNCIPGPDDSFTPGPALLKAIRMVFAARVDIPLAPPTWFDVTEEAIQHNLGLLEVCNFDLKTFLAKNQNSTLAFGSEFCPTSQLETILGPHPNFPFFKKVLANGMDFHFDQELSENERLAELDEMMVRGNHKSAQENEDDVKRLLQKDVHRGFSLPVTPYIVRELK